MTKILISSSSRDEHFIKISNWLKHRDVETVLFNPANLGEDSLITSVYLDRESTETIFKINGNSYTTNDIGLFWIRRIFYPKFENIQDNSDRENAVRVGSSFVSGLLELLSSSLNVVNPYSSLMIAEKKVYQYSVATQVGINTIESIVSNNAADIKKFLSTAERQNIFKPLCQLNWVDQSGKSSILPTTKIQDHQATHDAVRYFPGIFQRFVDKDYEVRVVFLENKYIAGKISSKTNQKTFDWRLWPVNQMCIEPVTLPVEIFEASLRLLSALRLKMGIFDFIVDKSGKYFFMEVNPSGNFLAMEDICPDLKLTEFIGKYLILKAKTSKQYDSEKQNNER